MVGILTDPKNFTMFLMLGVLLFAFLFYKQKIKTNESKDEIVRLHNNLESAKDSIKHFKDEYGNNIAEITGLRLSLSEIRDSFKTIKTKPPVTIVKYETIIKERETVDVDVTPKDSSKVNNLNIVSNKKFERSFNNLNINVPYILYRDSVRFGKAQIELDQNIWFETQVLRDELSKKVLIKLKTDYPDIKFNDISGILLNDISVQSDNINKLSVYKQRKTYGFGFQFGIGFNGAGFSPYAGIGFNYTPRFLQW